MTSPLTNDPAVSGDRVLEVFGETVIVRRDPAGQVLDAAVVEEIVPPGVGAPLHRHSRRGRDLLRRRGKLPDLA